MIGRKLLLADDSVTIQKVIDLTFSDEGMQVVTVGDGDQAARKLEEFTPDVILADVLMPGLNGYQLCELIKQNDRWKQIPVMLLVGSFEPFDEAEARRVGADDFLTKPFQSIKQLVSRVGSLLGGKPAEVPANGARSTLGLGFSRSEVEADTQPPPAVSADHDCAEDIELQTADTQELEPGMVSATHSDPLETNTVNIPTPNQATSAAKDFDVLLDLDDFDGALVSELDDVILDLDYDAPPVAAPSASAEVQLQSTMASMETSIEVAENAEPIAIFEPEFESKVVSDWAIVSHPPTVEVEPAKETVTHAGALPVGELSVEAIEAIARRVVEKLSDKVVREIAWDVVPELAELLIKQRLDEKKS